MKPGGGKGKGSSFERDICRELTHWITGKSKPEIFWRTATSGGKFTQEAKGGIKGKMPGDIMSVDKKGAWFAPPDGAFVIECKDVKDIGLEGLLYGTKGGITTWWEKLSSQAEEIGKSPLLICKQLRKPELIFFDPVTWDRMVNWFDVSRWSKRILSFAFEEQMFVGSTFGDFIATVDAKSFKHFLTRG